ncbi:MAG: nucleotidyltransferase domain-containing protein [Paracoccaceae bacterium]|nr:nucleotidyltransferase domain-containing protein [Paracoccaceae bacterium]MDE2675822.1 nucleotidyltransferase domain-containing protein [Paracoccaceae bacterium]MDE2738138.1 nucleotidyltransferase domain-containing protein [Paracoccaceae bacterium]MXZ49755.1 DNA polymerase III subunit beta [Paracoccaceae bacterium]MYF46443.1 DNA polymerase III subunit beta [Paracoccaceae bacterium]
MHRLIASKQEEIAVICRRHRVERLEVFGSAARGTDFDPSSSDADFLVEFKPPLLPDLFDRKVQMLEDLQMLLGRKVDLVRSGTIRNPYRKKSIDKDREVVFDG